jgi:hypothetical protein
MTSTHLAATTDPKKVAEILRAMDGYKGNGMLTVRCALRELHPLKILALQEPLLG